MGYFDLFGDSKESTSKNTSSGGLFGNSGVSSSSLFDFFAHNDESTRPFDSTVAGYGEHPYSTTDEARGSFFSTGQVHDNVTGIVGRDGKEAHNKAVALGLKGDALYAFDQRISRR